MSAYIVGLTGGIGSGKSTVADAFVDAGAGLVDTDAIAHRLTAPGGGAMPALLAAFGPGIVDAHGALARTAMRQRVFADVTARAQLEAILHPLIRQQADADCLASTAPYVILAVPLLVETGAYQARCDRILVIDCPESLQIRRVMARSGLSADEVAAIMATQVSRAERLAVADEVLLNEGGLDKMRDQVRCMHQEYLRRAREKT